MTTFTASWIAAVRAREATRPDRLFDDPHARDLAGERGFVIMAASERAAGAENAYIPVRVRWFDDLVASAAPGMRQVVVLGAGLDTRPVSVDRTGRTGLVRAGQAGDLRGQGPCPGRSRAAMPTHVVVGDVGADWRPALLDAGFDRRATTLWLAEGLFFYLTEATIAAIRH